MRLLAAAAVFLALAGSAAAQNTNPQAINGCRYNSTPPTITNLQPIEFQCDANGQLKITGTVTTTPSGTQDVNLTQVAGVAVAKGHGTAATAIRVELPTDGTGTVGLIAGSAIIGSLVANQTVNVAQINGVTPLMGTGATGTGSPRVTVSTDNVAIPLWGHAGTGASPSGVSVVRGGGTARTAEGGAYTTGTIASFEFDKVGKLLVLPYALPEQMVSGAITSAMTGTTSTSLVAAPAGSLRNYITNITCSNASATTGTDIAIQDGSGGTTLYTLPAAAVYGGASVVLPTPLRQPTAATALFVANVTTGASTKCSASGYTGL